MAHKMDLFIDHDMVTAKAVPNVIPPRTDSVTLFPEFAMMLVLS